MESIPLRLMIVAVVASVSIVPAANALQTLEDKEFLRRAGAQLDMVVACAQVVAIQGVGNVRTLELDFSGDSSIRFARLSFGDFEGGAYMSSVVLELSTGAKLVRTCSDPAVWICSGTFGPLEVSTQAFDLRLETELHGRALCVVVWLS